ncbi:PREDICTED: cell division cycle protein 27 homolog B-like isoform X2 [Tarenaya hassleriana]|uniref:cell division cycle protein 27 homolog B-like isoform X2 n=1 Tax=Tarenaya hassleriana TaxID=28532 RepID=UPI00053C1440|nr:PREDICTED: cell division cycle protein 27 homolog B-like isoform X2 [Tarenaya hassleriana]
METILVDCVQNSLRLFMYKNAIFMCERLLAEFPSEINLQLLAAVYLQSGQAYSAYHLLKGTQMAQSRYLFALSCFHMDLPNEAASALCPPNEPGAEIPNGAAGHYLLGLVYKLTDRKKNAVQQFRQALTIDPLLWGAYEELCALGAAEEATAVFDEAAALSIQKQYMQQLSTSHSINAANEECDFVVPNKNFSSEDPSPRQSKLTQGNSLKDISGNYHAHGLNGGASNMALYNTPSPVASQLSGIAPPPLFRNVQPAGPNPISLTSESSPKSTVNSTIQAPRRKFVDEGKLRKISGRLFSDSGPRRSTRLSADSGANSNSNVSAVSGNGNTSSKYLGASKLSYLALRSVTVRKGQSWANENIDEGVRNEPFDDSRPNTASTTGSVTSNDAKFHEQEEAAASVGSTTLNIQRITSGASEILSLLRILGEGYRLSCLYRCQEALDMYTKLPHKHYNTGWVLSQVGKAYFELIDYLEAERAFHLARQASPYSLEGMDIYSTVLYHLKEDMKLCYLAQELMSTDRLAPQSWIAMGNCYSLRKDHETSLKNFQRAVQLNPKFAYAHTLCGHELSTLEDYENGMRCYQNALHVDTRHYNAWYGLGMTYLRQEKFELSEHHFRMAFLINSSSSVIMSYLGTALHALSRSEEAIETMERAIQADKKNPLPMYQKANILVSLERYDEAIEVLEELKGYAPCESSVYALMGRIYKRRNMHDKAMLHFGLALDMKPPAADVAAIKAAMEKLHVPDEMEDSP